MQDWTHPLDLSHSLTTAALNQTVLLVGILQMKAFCQMENPIPRSSQTVASERGRVVIYLKEKKS